MIALEEGFDVPAAPRTVWAVLSDPRQVVPCVPGAQLGDQQADGSFDTSVGVKFGPTKVTFRTRVALEMDDATLHGRFTAQGRDTLGGARVQASATFDVQDTPGQPGAHVAISGSVDISGRLASLIESGASAVVRRMSAEFATALAERCAAATAQQQ
ncbi:MAG: SRPBCC family protein [Chloroflexota bacterium]